MAKDIRLSRLVRRGTYSSLGDAGINTGVLEGTTGVTESNSEATIPPNPQPLASLSPLNNIYESLPVSVQDRSIRVLDLDAPSSGGLFAGRSNAAAPVPLTGRLRVVSLKSSPAFTALSYVWGGPSTDPEDTITVNGGCVLPITTNCRQALLALRRRYGAVTIWIDAICMNQADDTEKATQIPLMEEIYSWAECTYVWLDHADESTDRAMAWLAEKSRGTIIQELIQYSSAASNSDRRKLLLALWWRVLVDEALQDLKVIRSLKSWSFTEIISNYINDNFFIET
jgi:hypothetical protein